MHVYIHTSVSEERRTIQLPGTEITAKLPASGLFIILQVCQIYTLFTFPDFLTKLDKFTRAKCFLIKTNLQDVDSINTAQKIYLLESL